MPVSPLAQVAKKSQNILNDYESPMKAVDEATQSNLQANPVCIKNNTNLLANLVFGPTTTVYSSGEQLKNKKDVIEKYDAQVNIKRINMNHKNKKLSEEYDDFYMTRTDQLSQQCSTYEAEYTSKRAAIIESIREQINEIKARGKQRVGEIIKDYVDTYNNESHEIEKCLKILNHLITEFNIEKKITYNLIVSKDEALQYNPNQIAEIAINDVNTLNTLTENLNLKEGKVVNKLLELEKSKNKLIVGSAIGVGLLTAPLICSFGSANLLKSLSNTHSMLKQKDNLREEILRLQRALQVQKVVHMKDYKEPDVEKEINLDVDDAVEKLKQSTHTSVEQLDAAFSSYKSEYEYKKAELQKQLDIKRNELDIQQKNNLEEFEKGKVGFEEQIEYLEQDYIKFYDEVSAAHRELVEYVDRYKEDLLTLIEYINIKQVAQDYVTISEFELAEEVDSSAPLYIRKMQEYDLELRSELVSLKSKLMNYKMDGESYEDMLNRYKAMIFNQHRKMDKYYIASMSDKILGEASHSEENMSLFKTKEFIRSICGYGSTLCIYKNQAEEAYIVDFIKYLVQQTLYKAEPLSCRVNVIDKSKSLLYKDIQYKFYNPKDKADIRIVDVKTLDKEITEYYSTLEEQLSLMSKEEIVDCNFQGYVQNMRDKGAKTPTTYINILHRENLTSAFQNYTESSNDTGIINIFIAHYDDLFKTNEDKTVSLQDGLQRHLQKFNNILEVERLHEGYCKFDISREDVTQEFHYYKRTSKEILDYKKKLEERYDPNLNTFVLTSEFVDKVVEGLKGGKWSLTPEDGIQLFFGPNKGDMSNILPVILDEDDKPHMFIGGTTGGGKSNTLAVMVNTLKMTYAPSSLQVVYFDFKVVEVGMHISPYKMPHCIAMCGTECAEYLNSLFKYVVGVMDYRYNYFNQLGVVNLLGARKKLKEERKILIATGLEEQAKAIEVMPALLIIIDEAAQGAQHEDDKVVETYVSSLLTLGQKARAAGIHMLLTSQDPDKMPQPLMPLISTRGCTKADRAVSQSVIHNSVCSLPENQYKGFFATNNSLAGEAEKNQIYVVPYNKDSETKRFTKISYEYAMKHDVYYDAVVFDENDLYTEDKLQLYVSEHPKFKKDGRLILGEGCFFRRIFKPYFIDIKKDDMQHVLISSSNLHRRINMYKGFIDAFKGRAVMIPGFTKGIPSYVDLSDFYDDDSPYEKCHSDKFFYMAGKGMFEPTSPEVEDGLVRPIYQGDIYNKPTPFGPNDYTEDELEELGYDPECEMDTFITYIKEDLDYYKDNGGDSEIPIFYIIFDFDKHPQLIAREIDFKEIAATLNDASCHNIHVVIISATASPFMEKQIFGHCLLSKLGSDPQLDRKYTKIPKRMAMYGSEVDVTQNCLYKVTQYIKEPDELETEEDDE